VQLGLHPRPLWGGALHRFPGCLKGAASPHEGMEWGGQGRTRGKGKEMRKKRRDEKMNGQKEGEGEM